MAPSSPSCPGWGGWEVILEQDQANGEQLSQDSPARGKQTGEGEGGRKDAILSLLLHRGALRCTRSNPNPPSPPSQAPPAPLTQTHQPISSSSPKGEGSRGDARQEGSSQHLLL